MAVKKKAVLTVIKLQIQGGKATPAPPIGPALGQHGLSIMDFCKAYNDATKDMMGDVVPVEITVYQDRTFTFILKTPPVSDLIKKTLKIKSGSSNPNTKFVGTLSGDQVDEIVKIKIKDLSASTNEAARRIIEGSARSMGIKVKYND
jgi:large subunit ribosomal protein L11